jgi:hypothetical protein
MLYAIAASVIARGKTATFAILAGAIVTNLYLVFLYARASRRGREAGSTGWANA